MKIDFSKIIFMNEFRVTLDAPDGWVKRWIWSNLDVPVAKRRFHESGRYWYGLELSVKPFKADERVKLNSTDCSDFMGKTFLAWYKFQPRCLKVKFVCSSDNALSLVFKLICDFFKNKRLTGEKIMRWLPSSPNLNPFENRWSIVKKKLYELSKPYNGKAGL